MKKFIIILAIALCGRFAAEAQKCVNPHFDTQRLDYRDLGYPGATEIPADDSPITALLAHSNGHVYGATTGKQSHLFYFDNLTNKVYPLGTLPRSEGVHHTLLEGKDGLIYVGTGRNEIELLTLSADMPHGRRAIETQLWQDIKDKYSDYQGGHIFLYDPSKEDNKTYLGDAPAEVTDLGVPVKGNSIYAMTIDMEGEKIYGISYPDAILFEYDISDKTSRQLGKWVEMLSYPGPERSWRGVPRAIICGQDGKVYSSSDNGLLRRYDPATGKFDFLEIRIPGEYWETQNYNAFPVVEQLIALPDSTILGSSSDGFIFKADPYRGSLKNYGKPRIERRVRAMCLSENGVLYMICGEKDNVCRLFSFSENEGFNDYGVLGVDRSPYYAKIAYQFDSMCIAGDGTVFIGESDRRAKLFLFLQGKQIFKGTLNPTNPR